VAAEQLFERERELRLIEDAIGSTAAGRGRLVLFEGEAGIGKTSLLRAAEEIAADRGFAVLPARAGILERSLGFGVARQLLEGPLARATEAERQALLTGAAALAAPVLGASPGADRPPRGEELAAMHGLHWLLCNLAERGPLLVSVDDAQWCDEMSLRWLLYLIRRIDRLPVAILIAARSDEPGPAEPLLAELAGDPLAELVRPGALGEEATAALLERIGGDAVEAGFGRACREWTGGNPWFVVELASELADLGIEPTDAAIERLGELRLEGVARVTMLRLKRLPAAALELARGVAVLGSGAQLRGAAELARLDEAEAIAACDRLVEARVLEPGQSLRFVHPLVRAVLYESLPPSRRAAEHKRAARVLGRAGARPEEVAAHLLESAPAGEQWVVEALLAAAERELRRSSAPSAVALLRRAREEPPGAAALSRVLHQLGLAESLAGEPAAEGSLREALEASGDPAERGAVALLLGRVLLRAGHTRQAVAALEPVIDALDAAELDLRLQLEATLLTAAMLDGRLLELAAARIRALGASEEALGADSHGGRLIAAQLAWAATADGSSLAVSLGLARRALGEGRLVREAPITPDAYLLPILMLALCDELEEADSYCRQALEQESGSVPAIAGTLCFRAGIALAGGRLEESELLARDALRLAAEAGGLTLVAGLVPAYLANALLERGEAAAALDVLGDPSALESSPLAWSAELLFAAGRAQLAAGRAREGLELLLACGRRCEAWRVLNPAWLPWRSQAALVLHRLGDEAEALELSGEELRRARRFGARRPLGVALRARGLIEGGEEGLELLAEAVTVLGSSPARLERARALVALGAALRRAGRRREARPPLAEGLEIAERCGAAPLAAEARAELAACGARPRSIVRGGADALTPSERRVAQMAIEGLSNPEIAQALFVTRATVESHLHAAYGKLGIGSRGQLSAALGESQ
jgi:DNA-binding CsgD family transcriptional regulator